MKTLIALAASVAAGLTASFASAADFGDNYPPPREVYVQEPPPRPVLTERPYNDVYEENGNFYAPPHPPPYIGLFPNWRPRYSAPGSYQRDGDGW